VKGKKVYPGVRKGGFIDEKRVRGCWWVRKYNNKKIKRWRIMGGLVIGVGVKAGVSGDNSWITFKAPQLPFLFFFILVLCWNIPFLDKVNFIFIYYVDFKDQATF
jgi:hypothetical protein